MTTWRTHTCGELNADNIGQNVTLSGWIHNSRNLGGILFIDLRDHYGITQVVIHPERDFHKEVEELRNESVIKIKGEVIKRESINKNIPTGEVEISVTEVHIESRSDILPFPVNAKELNAGEDIRLQYRYLDLRREKMHKNIQLRANVISHMRSKMTDLGFLEFQTPILTSSSPEGARDFVVPSRLHPGKFFALPQAPQQFKQLLMNSGFDKYFQIAPCFRDEDPRADRSPGEFYQLDVEMAFATQEDVFTNIEALMIDLFEKFSDKKIVQKPFPRIPYRESMAKYGSDKPDIRFGMEMNDVSEVFQNSEFKLFKGLIEKKDNLAAIAIPGGASKSRKFYSELEATVKAEGLGGLPWLAYTEDGAWKGSIAKFVEDSEKEALITKLGLNKGDSVAFIVGEKGEKTLKAGGKARVYLAEKLEIIPQDVFAFCWIVDFPMYEYNDDLEQVDFSHNPFSMPQGGLDDLENKDPLDILAYQYDIVCNGYELSSGAVRNHRRDIMEKAFELAGYSKDELETNFSALYNAFRFGAPPHAGIAPGIERIVMLLAEENTIREVIAFPMNQRAQCLLTNAPAEVKPEQLKDVHIGLDLPKSEE